VQSSSDNPGWSGSEHSPGARQTESAHQCGALSSCRVPEDDTRIRGGTSGGRLAGMGGRRSGSGLDLRSGQSGLGGDEGWSLVFSFIQTSRPAPGPAVVAGAQEPISFPPYPGRRRTARAHQRKSTVSGNKMCLSLGESPAEIQILVNLGKRHNQKMVGNTATRPDSFAPTHRYRRYSARPGQHPE
jgi:hypothetical protein